MRVRMWIMSGRKRRPPEVHERLVVLVFEQVD
jgi:hypothetical protein